MLRLSITEQGLTEILAVAEHISGMAMVADGFRLRPNVPSRPVGEEECAAPACQAAVAALLQRA